MSAVDSLFTGNKVRDPLKGLFAATESFKKSGYEHPAESSMNGTTNGQSNSQPDIALLKPKADPQPSSASAQGATTSENGDGEEGALQAEAKDISGQTVDGSVKIDHFITQDKAKDDAQLNRNDLVLVLETFVNALMDKGKPAQPPHENLPSPISFEPPKEDDGVLIAAIEEKDATINELRTLLVEAQGTIIKLLTDRVEDKAKLATLEAHARYLPDFQRQQETAKTEVQPEPNATEVGGAEDLKEDLTKVKAELEAIQQTLKTNAYKNSFDKPSRWGSIKSWLSNFISN